MPSVSRRNKSSHRRRRLRSRRSRTPKSKRRSRRTRRSRKTQRHLKGGFEWPEWFSMSRNYQLLKAIKAEVSAEANKSKTEGIQHSGILLLFNRVKNSVSSSSTSVKNWVSIVFMAFVYSVFPRKWAKYMNKEVGILDDNAVQQMEQITNIKRHDYLILNEHDYAFMVFEILQLMHQSRIGMELPANNKITELIVPKKNGLSKQQIDASAEKIIRQAIFETFELNLERQRQTSNETVDGLKPFLNAENDKLIAELYYRIAEYNLAKENKVETQINASINGLKNTFTRIAQTLESRSLTSNTYTQPAEDVVEIAYQLIEAAQKLLSERYEKAAIAHYNFEVQEAKEAEDDFVKNNKEALNQGDRTTWIIYYRVDLAFNTAKVVTEELLSKHSTHPI